MNAFLEFESQRRGLRVFVLIALFALFVLGIFTGSQFRLSAGEEVNLNSPYTLAYMTGLLSLVIVFIATAFAGAFLFPDIDHRSEHWLFALPVTKRQYFTGRFLAFFLVTFCCFLVMMIGFAVGQPFRIDARLESGFHLFRYLLPIVFFGGINALLVCSILFLLTCTTRHKLLVIVGGLLLYVLYMVALLFSNSPFMAGAFPQSVQAQTIAAVADPFGLSAYFFDTRLLTPAQRNGLLMSFSGFVAINRLLYLSVSLLCLWLAYARFSFAGAKSTKSGSVSSAAVSSAEAGSMTTLPAIRPEPRWWSPGKAILSFASKDISYLSASVSVPAVAILLLFAVGMEMYAEIEKGIRIPQQYASSGLMAGAIMENFHPFGLVLLVYFTNELFWRSRLSRFDEIENSTLFASKKLQGHIVSLAMLLLFFTFLLVAEALLFQWAYGYRRISWPAYGAIPLLTTMPLLLFAALLLWINLISRNKTIALGFSLFALLLAFAPVSQKILTNPLARIFSGFREPFSDFLGFGPYLAAFGWRILSGVCLVLLLLLWTTAIQQKKINRTLLSLTMVLFLGGIWSGHSYLTGYQPVQPERQKSLAADYEKRYRHFRVYPQPVIKQLQTNITLFPADNGYNIEGRYVLVNPTTSRIDSVLVQFPQGFRIEFARWQSGNRKWNLHQPQSVIALKQSLLPNDSACLLFKLSYRWYPVNGHQPVNAIVGNGSFIRISRYFPSIGYQADHELTNEGERAAFGLDSATIAGEPGGPDVFRRDFISLDMTVSTDTGQTVIGTGDLVRHWREGNRYCYQYRADSIPFRFGISSARYAQKTVNHRGIPISVYYEPSHAENADRLLQNAVLTMDYCTEEFGHYPFNTLHFAEVSNFTRGFAATAYPAAVFMPENMIFHADVGHDRNQDVINELAGHELSHMWWGNSLINPDDRLGAALLTETLAMYTEMMLYKRMYGKAAMMERVKMHQQLYETQKGFSVEFPLYRVPDDATAISYSKGAVAMVTLSELIGEKKLNTALRRFLETNHYPKKPTSMDLLKEFYRVSPGNKRRIDDIFMR